MQHLNRDVDLRARVHLPNTPAYLACLDARVEVDATGHLKEARHIDKGQDATTRASCQHPLHKAHAAGTVDRWTRRHAAWHVARHVAATCNSTPLLPPASARAAIPWQKDRYTCKLQKDSYTCKLAYTNRAPGKRRKRRTRLATPFATPLSQPLSRPLSNGCDNAIVASRLFGRLAGAASRKNKTILPEFGRGHVARGSSGLELLHRRAPIPDWCM